MKPPAKRPRESTAAKQARAAIVYDGLASAYPTAGCELDHLNAYQLIVATILSAQCTDARVNMVTPALFAKFPNAASLARARRPTLEKMIKSTGFFLNKSKSLVAMAQAVMKDHGGEIPKTMDALVKLPGVGRKTANVVLGNAFGVNEGIVVDTHVTRLSRRLGFTAQTDPVKIEAELMPLFPHERWTMLAHLLIWHGRRVCDARKPRCGECTIAAHCPSRQL